MKRSLVRVFVVAVLCGTVVLSCRKETTDLSNEPPQFAFTVYPGARYLAQLTEVTKQAHRIMNPDQEPPPTAIYDSDAPVEQVAEYYARAYGYNTVAPDATNNLSVSKPPAYYRTGDLAVDIKPVQPLLPKLKLTTDVTKAVGKYKSAYIEPRPNRPRVTVQRPYFDVTTSQVVDRTMILMGR